MSKSFSKSTVLSLSYLAFSQENPNLPVKSMYLMQSRLRSILKSEEFAPVTLLGLTKSNAKVLHEEASICRCRADRPAYGLFEITHEDGITLMASITLWGRHTPLELIKEYQQ